MDEFVDEVEVAFEQLADENENLKKQIEALKASPAVEQAAPVAADSAPAEPETIVVTTGAEASSAVVRLVTLSTEQAERLVNEATAEATEIRESANASAQEVTGDAQTRADRITAEARRPPTVGRAKERADNLDSEIAGRRSELLDGLQAERDDLQVAVGQLRGFEASFRANLTEELRRHIAAVESGTAQPYEVPALADPSAVAAGRATVRRRRRRRDGGETAGDGDASGDRCRTTPPDSTTSGSEPVFPEDDPADDADGPATQRHPSSGRPAGRPALTAVRR